MTDLWAPRRKAIEQLESQLVEERVALDALLDLCDEVLPRLHQRDEMTDCRLAWIVLLKARRVAHGIYSLILDCLGQEAGAFFRILQEASEFLTYLQQDPKRADLVVDSGKPPAGEIAKAIEGRFKALREYFNEHASHLSLSPESLAHTIDFSNLGPRVDYSPTPESIRRNLAPLFAFFFFSVGEACKILQRHDAEAIELFGDRLESLRTEGYTRLRRS